LLDWHAGRFATFHQPSQPKEGPAIVVRFASLAPLLSGCFALLACLAGGWLHSAQAGCGAHWLVFHYDKVRVISDDVIYLQYSSLSLSSPQLPTAARASSKSTSHEEEAWLRSQPSNHDA